MLTTRFKVFLIHLTLTLIFLSILNYIIKYIWYPEPLLFIEGGDVLSQLFNISLIVIPFLTLYLFKPGKKGLISDLVIIISLQIFICCSYIYSYYTQRPLYLAFNVDRFNTVQANQIIQERKSLQNLNIPLFSSPQPVYVNIPEDNQLRLKVTLNAINGGRDFYLHPEYYSSSLSAIKNNTAPITYDEIINTYPMTQEYLKHLLQSSHLQKQDLLFFPLVGKKKDAIILLSKESLDIMGYLSVDPWKIKK